jgi:uncharacterized lipoprotein YajG
MNAKTASRPKRRMCNRIVVVGTLLAAIGLASCATPPAPSDNASPTTQLEQQNSKTSRQAR